MPLLSLGNHGTAYVPIEDSTLTENRIEYDEVLKRQKDYTKLLTMYRNTARTNLYIKIIFKVVFFVVTISIWLYTIHMFKLSFDVGLNIINTREKDSDYINSTIDLLAALVPSLVSLITSFIVIPKIIAKYLFNIKEENSMLEILKSLQSYDEGLCKQRYDRETLVNQNCVDSQDIQDIDSSEPSDGEEANGSSDYEEVNES